MLSSYVDSEVKCKQCSCLDQTRRVIVARRRGLYGSVRWMPVCQARRRAHTDKQNETVKNRNDYLALVVEEIFGLVIIQVTFPGTNLFSIYAAFNPKWRVIAFPGVEVPYLRRRNENEQCGVTNYCWFVPLYCYNSYFERNRQALPLKSPKNLQNHSCIWP